jgi:mRNA interferase MazF
MRAIHIASMDKTRPVLILTREQVRPLLKKVTVATITTTRRGLTTEVLLDPRRNGVDKLCVVSCDNITTIPVEALGRAIGRLMPDQEAALAAAIAAAFDLE